MARTDRDVNLKALIGNQLQYIYSADELTNVLNTLASNIAVPAGFRRPFVFFNRRSSEKYLN